ncbi:elongation factor 2 [Mycena latifolia]|nr:elongation factor 2 [Mycena latifolia]
MRAAGLLLSITLSHLHLEVTLKALEDFAGVSLKVSVPIVPFRETVAAESSIVAFAKSPNKHNRLYIKASPLGEELSAAIDRGAVGPHDDFKARARVLAEEYGWDAADARKIWAFEPDANGANMLVDTTKGVQFLHGVKDSCLMGFQWAAKKDVCAEEPMRGVRLDLMDVMYYTAIRSIGRRANSPRHAARHLRRVAPRVADAARACLPWYVPPNSALRVVLEIQCPSSTIGGVYSCLNTRRAQVFSEEQRVGTPMFTV